MVHLNAVPKLPWKIVRPFTAPLCAALMLVTGAGCTPDLRVAPAPQQVRGRPATGEMVRLYDYDRDGRIDYRQTLAADGRIRLLEFDADQDSRFDRSVDRRQLDPRATRHLFVLLDGVGFRIIHEMWQKGHFRLFSPPGRLVSTFPSLTDPTFCEFFHVPGPLGYEASYFDRTAERLKPGTSTYLSGINEPWVSAVDHRLNEIEDAVMYLFPGTVLKRELAEGRRVYNRSNDGRVVLYFLSTDGIGHMYTYDRAWEHFALLDAWIEKVVHDAGGDIHVTMFSDHGNNFMAETYIPIDDILKKAGLRVGEVLQKPGDVVVPKFGLINFASVFCYSETERERVSEVIAGLEGVDLVAWRDGADVVVRNADGLATIARRADGLRRSYRYNPLEGDPLALRPVTAQLARRGLLSPEGFAPDDVWFEATALLPMPDPLHRIYHSLTSASLNPADIVISLADGYYFGDRFLDSIVDLGGTHGGIGAASTVSFLMSTAFEPPPIGRHEDLLGLINRHVAWTPHVPWVDYTWLERYRRAAVEGSAAAAHVHGSGAHGGHP